MPRANILRGILRVAIGRPDGIGLFADSPGGFLASLAPLIAFPVVGTLLLMLGGDALDAVTNLAATVAVLLAPAVLSFELARLWRREAYWLRFATAFNWCQWLLPALASVLLLLAGAMVHAGFTEDEATGVLVVCLAAYGLWLHWFLAHHGLALPRLRAMLLVIGVNVGTGLMVLAPHLLTMQQS